MYMKENHDFRKLKLIQLFYVPRKHTLWLYRCIAGCKMSEAVRAQGWWRQKIATTRADQGPECQNTGESDFLDSAIQ